MNRKVILILIISIGAFLGLIFLFSIFSKPKTNWVSKFGTTNKSPFGYYILYQELEKLTNAKKLIEVNDLSELEHLNPKTDAIFHMDERTHNFFKHSPVQEKINNLKNKPFTVFYGINNLNQTNHFEFKDNEKAYAILQQQQVEINQNRHINEAFYLKKYDNFKPIGYIKYKGKEHPNYLLKKDQKQQKYVHIDPILLSNFYLLQPNGYAYAKEVLKPLNGKTIYWINPDTIYSKPDNQSALSFILSQPELKTAWYILLIALLLFLIFKSKREQKSIPIVQAEKNLSLEYANVIASMYYESGKPIDIITKKIDYFYHSLRKNFNLNTENIYDEQFIYILAQKAQITTEDAKELITELDELYHHKKATLKDVAQTHKLIENYKKKAQIL